MFLVSGDTFSEPSLQDGQGTQKFLLQFGWKHHISMRCSTELISDMPVVSPSPGWHCHQIPTMGQLHPSVWMAAVLGEDLPLLPVISLDIKVRFSCLFLAFLQLYRLPSCPTSANRPPSGKDGSCQSGKAALGKNNVRFWAVSLFG